MMPWPLIVFFTALIGWPVIKLIATLVSRPRWKAQKAVREELLQAYGDGDYEPLIIEAEFLSGKGELINLALPIVAFFGGIVFVFEFMKHRSNLGTPEGGLRIDRQMLTMLYPEAGSAQIERLTADERFLKLQDRAFELQLLRYPVCGLLTIIVPFPAIVFFVFVEGIRISLRGAAKNMIEASHGAAKFFMLSLLAPPKART